MKDHIEELIAQALLDLQRKGELPSDIEPTVQVERARAEGHGDYACNIAMTLAKAAKCPPRELATKIVDNLLPSRKVAQVDIAGPGFINFTLSAACQRSVIKHILEQGDRFGCATENSGPAVNVEFVSANPTGPLHVGHGRGAAYGASLAALLKANGYRVESEYYVNDHGRQMDILATSVWIRYLELGGMQIRFPDNGYRGDYIYDIARTVRSEHGDALRRSTTEVLADLPADESDGGDKEKHIDALVKRAQTLLGEQYRICFEAALTSILDDIRQDLGEFQVQYDHWFSERSLADDGTVDAAIEQLRVAGHLVEKDGAVWFKATEFGDEKDRVVIRDDGRKTYFASDIAYVKNKFDRGYDRLIYILGADHHGYVARLRAAATGLGYDADRIEIPLVQFAILFRGGKKVQMGTRSGSFVTLRELRDEVGSDAARFFYAMRSHDQHLDFDLDLAKEQSADNPVYYVQYAHARISSVFAKLSDHGWTYNAEIGMAAIKQLDLPQELALMRALSRYPEVLAGAAERRSPHVVAHYLRELSQSFHTFYSASKVLIDDEDLRNARLNLAAATRQVLANGLTLLGVSAPDRMDQDAS